MEKYEQELKSLIDELIKAEKKITRLEIELGIYEAESEKSEKPKFKVIQGGKEKPLNKRMASREAVGSTIF